MDAFDIPSVRINDLRALLALAREPRAARAAAALATSQAALAAAVARVERAVGAALVRRTARGAELTAAGRAFAAAAERVLGELERAQRQVSDLGRASARVTISTFSAFAVRVLPQVIRRFRARTPEAQISIRERRQHEIMDDVRTDAADFGIGFIDSLPDLFRSELLRREPLYVVLPLRHRLARRPLTRVRLAEVGDERLVSPPGDTFLRRLVDEAASTAGIELRYGVTVERFLTELDYAAEGVGACVVPEGVLPPKPWTRFKAAPLAEPALSVSVGAILRHDRPLSPPARRMLDLIRPAARRRAFSPGA
jgi:DNA-binding transcriptional LysR family regulator